MRIPTSLYDSPVAHFVIDLQCRIVLWNRSCELLTGIPEQEALGSTLHQSLFNGSLLPLAELMLQHKGIMNSSVPPVVRTLKGHTWEAIFEVGTLPPLTVHCRATLLKEQDTITGAVQTMDVVDETFARGVMYEDYMTVVDNFPAGILVIQDEGYALVNQAFATMLGYGDSRELIGKPVMETIGSTHQEAFRTHLQELLAGDGKIKKDGWPMLHTEGNIIWVEGYPRRILWQGKPAAIAYVADVTTSLQHEYNLGIFGKSGLSEDDIRTVTQDRYRLGKLVGKSNAMRAVYQRILKAAPKDLSVLITGESGTGKEVVARTIHSFSRRSQESFVAVNCGAIPSELLESEFFGYKKGAFTGAYADKLGLLDKAHKGTLFLDEVAELPLAMQVKLLRFLDSNTFIPLGSTEQRSADIRIIAATNRDLKACIANGMLREDFYFRLYIIPIELPPLRERMEDIPLFIDEFIRQHVDAQQPGFLPGHFTDAMMRYSWPGNVRELQNTLERYLAIGALDIHTAVEQGNDSPLDTNSGNLRNLQRDHERQLFQRALDMSDGNRTKAAKLLGIPLRTFYRKLAQLEKDSA